ncbi:MAG: hypothetical protein AAFQ98_06460 [Bacteroidota bacterium]
MYLKSLLIASLFCLAPVVLNAQAPTLLDVNEQRIQTARIGMYTLGGWALANMAVGGVGMSRTTGVTRSFHQMNLFWNIVNLGIAVGSYYGMTTDDPAVWSPWQSLQHQMVLEKAFLFNAALDLAYMSGGLYLRERSKSDPARADQWLGWGNSILLQGGFLFAFDLAMYFILHPGMAELQPFLTSVQVSPTGFAMVIPLGR